MYSFIRRHRTPIDETVKFVLLMALGSTVLYYLTSPLISRMIAGYAQLAVANYFASEEPIVVNSTCEFIHGKIPAVPVAICEEDVNPFVNQTLVGLETSADQKIDSILLGSGNLYLAAYSLLLIVIGYAAKPALDRAYKGIGAGVNILYKKCVGEGSSEESEPLHTPDPTPTSQGPATSINI